MMIRNIGLCGGASIRHSSPNAAPLCVGRRRRQRLQQYYYFFYYSSKPSWLPMKQNGKKRDRRQEIRRLDNQQHSLHDMMQMAERELLFGMSAAMHEFNEDHHHHQESELAIFADSVESMFSDPFERLFQEADQQQWERHTTRIDLHEGTTITRSYSNGKASKAEMMLDPFDQLMNTDMFESESTLFFTGPRQTQRRTHIERHDHEWTEFMQRKEEDEESMAQQQQQQRRWKQFEMLAERDVLDALKRDDCFKRIYGMGSRITMGDKMCNFLSSSSSQYTIMEQTLTFTTGRGMVGTCTYQLQTLRSQQQNQHVSSGSIGGKRMDRKQRSAKKIRSKSVDGSTLDLVVPESQQQRHEEESALYYHINTILVEDYMGERWHVTIDNRADQIKNMASGKASDSTQETIYTAVVLENGDGIDPYSEEDEGARCYIVEKE